LKKNQCLDIWTNEYEKYDILKETKCIYLILLFVRNCIVNTATKTENFGLTAVFKFGQCSVSNSSVWQRMNSHFQTYNAVYSVPILIMQGDNPHLLEQIIRKKLEEYELKIACSNKIIPHEFYCVDEKIVDMIYFTGIYHKFNLLDNSLGDDIIDNLLPDQILEKIYIDEIQILDDTSNNLTSNQKLIIQQTYQKNDIHPTLNTNNDSLLCKLTRSLLESRWSSFKLHSYTKKAAEHE